MYAKRRLFVLLAIGSLVAACGLDAGEFRNAVPDEKSVTIQPPEGGNGQALTVAVGERSDFYNTTRAMTRDVNGSVRNLVGLVKDIVANPATSQDGNTMVWGPGADALDPAIFRFMATKTGDSVYTYKLQYRPKGSEDEEENYVSLLEGNSDRQSGVNDGAGDLTIYVDHWSAIEPGACGTGTLTVTYDTRDEPQFLAVDFDHFQDKCETDASHDALEAATYYYARYHDGSGNFQFTAAGDIDRGSALAGVNETFAIRSRWLPTGEGRSDVKIFGGDLEQNHGIEEITANECWDELFMLTYADMTPPGVDPSHADVGSEDDCAEGVREAQYATDLDLTI